MTQFRYLSTDALQFHEQVLSFLRYLVAQSTTVLVTSEGSKVSPDDDLPFVADGVINLDDLIYVVRRRVSNGAAKQPVD